VVANVNLFEISLDRMGCTVYQYDGSPFHPLPSIPSSHCVQLVRSRLHHSPSSTFTNRILPGIGPEVKAKRRIFEITYTVPSNNGQVFGIKPSITMFLVRILNLFPQCFCTNEGDLRMSNWNTKASSADRAPYLQRLHTLKRPNRLFARTMHPIHSR
jgi:hypothetical protein